MNYEKGKSPIIKGLIPGLTERGKIKIGMKGEKRNSKLGNQFQLPEKIDHFLVTTLERDENDNFKKDLIIHKEIGNKPKEIPIRLLFDDIYLNFQCRYTCFYGKTLFCSGDGEYANRLLQNGKKQTIDCPCERKEPSYTGEKGDGKGKCKINGTLSVLIDCIASSIGGVWKFRTTGYNSTVGILGSLQLIHSITGGLLAGIPLSMVITPKVTTSPDNKPVTIYVVGVQYKGNVDQLRQISLDTAQETANHRERMRAVEETAKKMISYSQDIANESADIVEEYHPEEMDEPIENPETKEMDEPIENHEKKETAKLDQGVDEKPVKKAAKKLTKQNTMEVVKEIVAEPIHEQFLPDDTTETVTDEDQTELDFTF